MTAEKSLNAPINFDRMNFPLKLHKMLQALEEEGFEHIAGWDPEGCSFRVRNQEELVLKIMPTYFKQTKYKSFQRQLNFYGFQRISSGTLKGSYYHKNFSRCKPLLCHKIERRLQASERPRPAASNKNAVRADTSLTRKRKSSKNRTLPEPSNYYDSSFPSITLSQNDLSSTHQPMTSSEQAFQENLLGHDPSNVQPKSPERIQCVASESPQSFVPQQTPPQPCIDLPLTMSAPLRRVSDVSDISSRVDEQRDILKVDIISSDGNTSVESIVDFSATSIGFFDDIPDEIFCDKRKQANKISLSGFSGIDWFNN